MKNIIFIAAPAAGKGTQSEMLQNDYGYEHISTGDLLREAVKNGNEEIGKIMASGALISDKIVFDLLEEKIKSIKGSFILDGFPRTLNQAKMLTELFDKLNIDRGVTIYLKIEKEVALKRSLGRLNCPNCSKGYNKYFKTMAPKVEGKCDDCGSDLVARSDDTEESFNNRFDIYLSEVEAILNYYEEQGTLKIVEVGEAKEETYEKIKRVLESD